ncbi:MAG: NINE protein [Clostridiales bacterium]|nr:NINE protein [Clostridiales bacterium]
MRCPKCYGKIDKTFNKCVKCGFDVNKLKKKASNKKAIEMKRQGDGDLCIETHILPEDVSKKKLLLFSILFGAFGAHYFYIGKMLRGLINLVFTVFMFTFATLHILNIRGGVLEYIEFFVAFGFVFTFISVINDIINILLNKFKVPVYIMDK